MTITYQNHFVVFIAFNKSWNSECFIEILFFCMRLNFIKSIRIDYTEIMVI